MERCHRAPQEHRAGRVDTSVRLEAAVSVAGRRKALLDKGWGRRTGCHWGVRAGVRMQGLWAHLGQSRCHPVLQGCGLIPAVLTDLHHELPLPPVPACPAPLPQEPSPTQPC